MDPIEKILGKRKSKNGLFNMGASFKMQKQWKGFSPIVKKTTRKIYPDFDRDGVPNKWDCQPRNPMRQDTVRYNDNDLYDAVQKNDLAKANIILKQGVSSNTNHNDGDGVIINAAQNENYEMCVLLLRYDARIGCDATNGSAVYQVGEKIIYATNPARKQKLFRLYQLLEAAQRSNLGREFNQPSCVWIDERRKVYEAMKR